MKTQFLCLLLALACLPSLRAQALKDRSFETPGQTLVSTGAVPSGKAEISGTIAEGWEDNTNWADVKIAYALDTASHTGRLSQRIDVGRGFAQFVQPVPFRPGRYRVSLWMRALPAQWVSLGLRDAGGPYKSYATRAVKVGAAWTQVMAEGVTPSVAGIVIVNTSGTGTLWLDDAALAFSADTGPPAQALSPPKGTVPRAFFGLNANHMHDPPGYRWPALSFGTFRTWDSGVIWPSVEPQRGVYHWDELDKDVAEARKRGEQFLFTLGLTPQWAAPKGPNTYAGVSAPPDNLEDRRGFVRALATRYKGRIAAYELWNEPDLTQFYSGTPAQMVALEKVTAESVHQADPSALVVTPPPSGGLGVGQLKWYDDYLTAGGGRYADVLAIHSYSSPPEGDIEVVRTYRALLAAHGLAGKPLWNTETGMELAGYTEAQAAAYLAREFITDWAVGLDRMFFYAYDNGLYFGLDQETPDGKNRNPAVLAPSGIAYERVEGWLTGARMLSCASDAHGTWTCALRRPNGRRAWIVWNTGESAHPFIAPVGWKVKTRRDLTGAAAPVSGRFMVSQSPVILEP